MRRTLAALGLSIFAVLAHANVEVVGLFKDAAVLRTPQGEELVRVGQKSRSGVKLISADARSAVVRYQGETRKLTLSNRVGSSFTRAEAQTISISPDGLGQYRVRGAINDRYANFLVDTGASVVALSSEHARALNISYKLGQVGTVVTAQGQVDARFITLETVNVGGVKAHNVAATVIEGKYPVDILLGMSFLKQVNMQNKGGVLTLSQN